MEYTKTTTKRISPSSSSRYRPGYNSNSENYYYNRRCLLVLLLLLLVSTNSYFYYKTNLGGGDFVTSFGGTILQPVTAFIVRSSSSTRKYTLRFGINNNNVQQSYRFVISSNNHLTKDIVSLRKSVSSSALLKVPSSFRLYSSIDGQTTASASNSNKNQSQNKQRVCIVVCPAQFCVPDDYTVLYDNLVSAASASTNSNIEIGTFAVCELPRTEWIKVAQQLPTADFWRGTLNVPKTLDWYFNAIDNAVSKILANEIAFGYTDIPPRICFIGHSIGGWVARAYLGGMTGSYSASTAIHRAAIDACTSLITLGTPHAVSSTALVDQTRGLIAAIDATPSCSPEYLSTVHGIAITCVCSTGIPAKVLSTNFEELLAVGSYVPLIGFNVLFNNNNNDGSEKQDDQITTSNIGDGIVPYEIAYLPEPAKRVVIDQCYETNEPVRHSHVVPTPWNLWNGYQSSIPVDVPSYVTAGVVTQWIQYIQ